MRVYYFNKGYNERRNLNLETRSPNLDYHRYIDVFAILNLLVYRLGFGVYQVLRNTHFVLITSRVKCVIHTFNGVVFSVSRVRWVSTFETSLPRLYLPKWMPIYFYYKAMTHQNCLGLVAISKASKDIFSNELNASGLSQEEISIIMEKTCIIHPPQRILVTESQIREKFSLGDVLELVFVGNDFFRKGGRIALEAFVEFTKYTANKMHLTIVSALNTDNWITNTTDSDVEEILNIIYTSENITLHRNLSNREVLDLIGKSHLGLLPTYQDTYGYSVLECQASGVPVVTTRIRALNEINHDSRGWLIKSEVPELIAVFKEIDSNREILLNKSMEALEYIKRMHCPHKHRSKLMALYEA